VVDWRDVVAQKVEKAMKRRDFLKLIGIAPIAPSVLAAMPKKKLTYQGVKIVFNEKLPEDGGLLVNRPIGFALEDISKDEYGWARICTQAQFICEQSIRSGKLVNVK